MIRTNTNMVLLFALGSLTAAPLAFAQSLDSPMTRMRPIGSPSAVDQYRAPAETGRFYQTAYQQGAPVRHADFVDNAGNHMTVRQLQFTAPPIPDSFALPSTTAPTSDSPFSNLGAGPAIDFPTTTSPLPYTAPPSTPLPSTAPPSTVLPSTSLPPGSVPAEPRGLPFGSGNLSPVPYDAMPGSGDLAPLAQPQLNDGFATIDNCPCVSPPSNYVSATGWNNCTPVSYQAPPAYVAPPTTTVVEPIVIPPSIPPRRSGIPRGPLISFGQDKNPVQIGQGIVGQPVAYVPGQRFRNFLRYIFP